MVSMSDNPSGVRSVAGPVEAKSEVTKAGAQVTEGVAVGEVVVVGEVVAVEEVVAVDEVVVAGELSGVAVVAGFAGPGVTGDVGLWQMRIGAGDLLLAPRCRACEIVDDCAVVLTYSWIVASWS